MKPSHILDKAILKYLSQKKNAINENNLQSPKKYKNLGEILNDMYIFMSKCYGYNESCVINALHRMDCTKDGKRYLNICIWISPQGNITYGPNRENLFTGWLTSKGKDYLYDLQYSKKRHNKKSRVNNTNIGTINNSGTTNVNSNINQQTNLNGNIKMKISKLGQCDVKDKNTLNKLVKELNNINNDKHFSKNRLSKFKPFVNKSWTVIGSALSDVLASLLLSRLGLK